MTNYIFQSIDTIFVVVEFEERSGRDLAIVHSLWFTLRKKEVFGLSYKDNKQYLMALKRGEESVIDTCKLYTISRFYEDGKSIIFMVPYLK